jgi:hypothetical protein
MEAGPLNVSPLQIFLDCLECSHYTAAALMQWSLAFIIKGDLCTRNTIFVSRRVAQQHPTKVGSVLAVPDAAVQHGATRKSCFV